LLLCLFEFLLESLTGELSIIFLILLIISGCSSSSSSSITFPFFLIGCGCCCSFFFISGFTGDFSFSIFFVFFLLTDDFLSCSWSISCSLSFFVCRFLFFVLLSFLVSVSIWSFSSVSSISSFTFFDLLVLVLIVLSISTPFSSSTGSIISTFFPLF